jgi:hypothetical protein
MWVTIMKRISNFSIYLTGMVILFIAFSEPAVSATTNCNNPVLITQAENTLSLYGLNASQELDHIWTLPPEFRPFRYPIVGEPTGGIPFNSHVRYSLENEPTDEIWFIPHVNDIVPSHDGCNIAFVTARYPMRGFGGRQLFIYSAGSGDLQQFDLNVQMGFNSPNLLWSPDNQYLAIAVTEGALYLYDTAGGTVVRFVSAESYTYFQWIGNEFLAFVQAGNIHLRSLDGEINRQLTEFDEHRLLHRAWFTWNPQSQRLFYAIGGFDESNKVYSVDLEGNNRLELDLGEFYPDEFASRVMGINVDENTGDVYIFPTRLSYQVTATDTRRVLRITPQHEVYVFMEIPPSMGIAFAALPPSADVLTILLNAIVERQLLLKPLLSGASDIILNGNICDFIYIDDALLAYIESSNLCWSDDSGRRDLLLLNTITGETVSLTSDMDEPIWLLSSPRSTASWELPQMTWILDR